jgi:hypothetical protein
MSRKVTPTPLHDSASVPARIVDYGQILQGQLADANTNGIPDICEGPTCNHIDLNLTQSSTA